MIFAMCMSAVSGYELALSIVKTTFELHGVPMDWVKDAPKLSLPSTYRQTNHERQYNWLRSHVRGTVIKLLKHYTREELIEVLGLQE